jgi:hypothetical protein
MNINGTNGNGDSVIINLKKSYWAVGILLALLSAGSFIANLVLLKNNRTEAATTQSFDFAPLTTMTEDRVKSSIFAHNEDERAHPSIIGALNEIKLELRYMNKHLETLELENKSK